MANHIIDTSLVVPEKSVDRFNSFLDVPELDETNLDETNYAEIIHRCGCGKVIDEQDKMCEDCLKAINLQDIQEKQTKTKYRKDLEKRLKGNIITTDLDYM